MPSPLGVFYRRGGRVCPSSPIPERPGNGEPPIAVTFAGAGKCVGYFMEQNLVYFVGAGGVTEVAGEGDAPVTVDALAKTSFCVVPAKAPCVELVLYKELTRS